MSLNIVVGGGSGFIGKALVNALRKKNHKVAIVSRQQYETDTITWDYIKDKGLPPNTDVVINFSGAKVIDIRHRFNVEAYKQVVKDSRINTTQWLNEAITSAPRKPKVWISSSAVGFYEPSFTNVYDEDSPGGSGVYPTAMVKEWEDTAKLPEECGVRQVIVRIGSVLGRGGPSTEGLLRMFRFGLGGVMGCGKQWFPWIHIDDVVAIYIHAIENENVSGILNAVSPGIVTSKEFASEMAAVLHRPSCCRFPSFLINMVLGNDWANLAVIGYNIVPKRTLNLGYNFLYPRLEEALQDLVS